MLGRVRGKTVELDEAITELDGKRVRVVLEAIDERNAASRSSAGSDDADRRLIELLKNAPLDDRPLDAEERRRVEDLRAGRAELVPHTDVRAKVTARSKGQ